MTVTATQLALAGLVVAIVSSFVAPYMAGRINKKQVRAAWSLRAAEAYADTRGASELCSPEHVRIIRSASTVGRWSGSETSERCAVGNKAIHALRGAAATAPDSTSRDIAKQIARRLQVQITSLALVSNTLVAEILDDGLFDSLAKNAREAYEGSDGSPSLEALFEDFEQEIQRHHYGKITRLTFT